MRTRMKKKNIDQEFREEKNKKIELKWDVGKGLINLLECGCLPNNTIELIKVGLYKMYSTYLFLHKEAYCLVLKEGKIYVQFINQVHYVRFFNLI